MKKLLAILICVAQFLSMTGNAATCTNYISDGFGNPIPTRVIITPFTPSIVFGGTNVLGPSVAFNAPQGAWAARLLGGFYLVQQGLGQPNITIFAAPNDPQTNSLAFFAIAATNPIPSFFSSGQGLAITVSNFNANQFIFAWNTISIITGALVTNLFDYGDFNVAGTNNTDGTLTIFDPATNAVAGFDTNKGGWYGQALSTNLWYPISTFVGPTNSITLNNTYWNYTTTSDVGITNTFGITNGVATWATLNISNQTALTVTGYVTVPFARAIGSQTLPNMPIPPSKVGMWSFLSVGGLVTNYVAAVQDASSAPATVTILFVNTNFSTNLFVNQAFITNLYVTQSFITNDTFVNTNIFISTTTNVNFNSIYVTNLYAITNFSTNLFFVSGKGNTLIITNLFVAAPGILANTNTANNSAVITDSAHAYTNAVNAHGVFTNSATGPPSFGLLQNTELVNSSLTIAGTANQITIGGGSPVALGGTATASLPSPVITPGALTASGIITGNGQSVTNIYLEDVVSQTNGVSSANAVDFSVREATTNIAGAVSFTSLLNFNQTNYNYAIRWLINRTGSDQTITVGTWETDSARQTATTYICTNNTTLGLLFKCQINFFTNVMAIKTFR